MTYRGSLPSGQAFNGQQHLPQTYSDPYGNGNSNGNPNGPNPPYPNAAYGGIGQAPTPHGNFHPSPVPTSAIPPVPAPMNMHANGYGQYPTYGGNFPQQQHQQPAPLPHYPHHQTQQPFVHSNVMNSPFVSPHIPHASFPQNTQAIRSPALAVAPAPTPPTPTYTEYQPQPPHQLHQQPQYQPHFQQPIHPQPRPQVQQSPRQQHVQPPQPAPQYAQYSQPAMGHSPSVPVMNQTFVEPSQVQLSPEPNHANSPVVQPARSPSLARKSPAISSMNSPAVSSRGSPALSTKARSYDTTAILIHVAEECFDKAKRGVQKVAASLAEEQVREYQKLITTGLACLEAAFQSNRLSPRQEARARLRYASILCDETENLQEAETALSKGITICEKHRYADLKYCMQYLLLKVLFQRNQKAAFIAIDKNISDCLTFKHYQWVYAFRLLKATFHVHAGSPPDAAVLENLRAIAVLASERNDHAMVVFASLLEATSATISDDTNAILRAGSSEHDYVVMTFLNKLEIIVLTYTFSGLAGMYRPGSESRRSHEFWKEGFEVLAKWNKEVAPNISGSSLQQSIESAKWRTEIFCYLQVLTGLYFATHSQWSKVEQCVAQLQQAITPAVNDIFNLFSLYLSGVYHQGTGDLETALILFEDERLSITAGQGGFGGRKPAKLELCILAALNRLWILQDLSYQDPITSTNLLDTLRPICIEHQDPDIRTAFNLVQATAHTSPPPSMHQIKTSITNSLNGSKVTGNTHCLAIALSIMRYKLFDNVVGEQALKSARAASTQAKRSGNLLWMSVADGMLADSFEVQALFADAEAARQTATEYASYALTGKESQPSFQSVAIARGRAYSDDAKAPAAPETANTKQPEQKTDQTSRGRSPRRPRAKSVTVPKPKKKKTKSPNALKEDPETDEQAKPEELVGPDVIKHVFESLKRIEGSYASINTRLTDLQEEALKKTTAQDDAPRKHDQPLKRQTEKLGTRLKILNGTLDVLKNVLNTQQIPLDSLTKRQSTTESPPKAADAKPAKKSKGATSSPKSTDATQAKTTETKPSSKKASKTTSKEATKEASKEAPTEASAETSTEAPTETSKDASKQSKELGVSEDESPKAESWTTLAGRMGRGAKVPAFAAAVAAGASAVGAASSSKAASTDPGTAPKPKRKSKAPAVPLNVQTIQGNSLELTPIEIPDMPEVPRLSYGLDRALFNPGVYHMQDPHSKVYNFDPYLANIMPINEFDFNALKKYVTSSKDTTLFALASKLGKKYSGSTSSMTAMLSHFHFLLSAWRPINASTMSKQFNADSEKFTQIMRAPSATFLHLRDGVYAIDADKEYDFGSILSMLGKSMEKLLTVSRDEFERYRRKNSDQISEEERNAEEAFHFTTMGDFLMRSQLDAYDPRLPGTGMFDLKTRSVVSIRMDAQGYQKGLGYEIRKRFGQWESFEREYYDMIRSTMLKYSLQVRMGRMDGIFVAYHNTQRIFGFQYLSINEMDLALHGTDNRALGDLEFKLSLHLLNKVLDRATARFPGRSIRLHIETRPTDPPLMYIFAKPVTPEEIEKIQSTQQVKIAEYERKMLGLVEEEASSQSTGLEAEDADSEAEQPASEEQDAVGVDETRNQQRQTQAFWEEMQEKVEAAIEDDALGVDHVREAIQDALKQSGLLKARTQEEARGYVDALLEALTRNQTDNDAEDLQRSDAANVETGTLAFKVGEGGELSVAEEEKPTASDGTLSDVARVNAEATEAQMLQESGEPSSASVKKQDSEARSLRDTGLKELILRLATSVDEKPELEEVERAEEETVSDVSKLRTFGRILSELVAKSKESAGDSTTTAASEVGDASVPSTEDSGQAVERPATSPKTDKTSESQTAGQETKEAEAAAEAEEGSDDEIIGMHLTVRNKVNGQDVVRPSSNHDWWSWSLEYSLEELPEERAQRIYKAVKARRRKALSKGDDDREEQWYSMFSGKLKSMSDNGRKYRAKMDQLAKKAPVYVVGRDEPMTWEEAFGYKDQWTPPPEETPENKKQKGQGADGEKPASKDS
ncbi:mitochondrial membrane protein Pet127 [Colletotrichum truncatum]|uniref:Mitochondrial membrane protein Pet127 n=1 Tax=Colletotrichum truncatum TaxID=5467 RepID=A0ACC3ZIG7_COLTU